MTDVVPQRYLDAAPAARSNLPDEIVARALWRYTEQPHVSTAAIADEACIHQRMIPLWARKAGTGVRPRSQRAFPPGAIQAAIDAYLAAGSLTAAADQLGISRGAVRNRVIAGGLTPDDRGTAISTRLMLVNDHDDGCMSTHQAARLVEMAPSTIVTRAKTGRIPGARLTTRGDGSGRPAWRIPTGWVHQNRPETPERGHDHLLPAVPFRDWLRSLPDEVRTIARRAGVSERRISGLRSGLQAWVSFETADRALTAYGIQLDELWPDIEDRIANPTTPSSLHHAAA